VLHRDLKTSNILFNNRGELKARAAVHALLCCPPAPCMLWVFSMSPSICTHRCIVGLQLRILALSCVALRLASSACWGSICTCQVLRGMACWQACQARAPSLQSLASA
jgi:hypothetical protein